VLRATRKAETQSATWRKGAVANSAGDSIVTSLADNATPATTSRNWKIEGSCLRKMGPKTCPKWTRYQNQRLVRDPRVNKTHKTCSCPRSERLRSMINYTDPARHLKIGGKTMRSQRTAGEVFVHSRTAVNNDTRVAAITVTPVGGAGGAPPN
jgi:hypothetical protein